MGSDDRMSGVEKRNGKRNVKSEMVVEIFINIHMLLSDILFA